MFSRITLADEYNFPLTLKWSDVRTYIFICCFVTLGVLVPWILHHFYLAGPTFLPMPYLILMAGLLFGWRVGLITGLFTPLASYTISGMPVVSVLPQIVVELSTYGLIAGLLRDKLNLRVLWSLLGAMVVGRLALLMAGWITFIVSGQSYSPVSVETGPLQALWAVIKQGWPGILIQLVTIPIIIFFVEKSVLRGLASGDE